MYQTYIDNYNSNDFKEYLELNRKISDYRIKIRNSDKDKNFYFNEDKNNISIKYKKIKVDIKTNFWKLVEIISDKLSDGKKPPPETRVIVRFRELKSLMPEIFNKVRKIRLNTE